MAVVDLSSSPIWHHCLGSQCGLLLPLIGLQIAGHWHGTDDGIPKGSESCLALLSILRVVTDVPQSRSQRLFAFDVVL